MIAYAACFVLAVLAYRKARRERPGREAPFWAAVAAIMLVLAVDKQFQLQMRVGQVARSLALEQGVYDDRRVYQAGFIVAAALLATAAVGGLRLVARRQGWPLVPLVATTYLVAYNLAKAASLHQLDQLINLAIPGARLNLLIELPGVLAVGAAAARRLVAPGVAGATPRPVVRARVRPADSTRWLVDRSRDALG